MRRHVIGKLCDNCKRDTGSACQDCSPFADVEDVCPHCGYPINLNTTSCWNYQTQPSIQSLFYKNFPELVKWSKQVGNI